MHPLIEASFRGDVDAVQQLVDRGHDVNVECSPGGTPLHAAIENAQLRVVKLLLRNGASASQRGPEGWTSLLHAVDIACDAARQFGDAEISRHTERSFVNFFIICAEARDKATLADGRVCNAIELAMFYGCQSLVDEFGTSAHEKA